MAKGMTKINGQMKEGAKNIAGYADRPEITKSDKKEPFRSRVVDELKSLICTHSPAGISISSLDGCYMLVNPAFCRFLGYTENELMGLSAEATTHPDDLERIRRLRNNGLPEDSPEPSERRFIRKDGTTVWGLVSENLYFEYAGAPAYVLAIVQVISGSKLKGPVPKLESRVVELEAAIRELETFNYTVSHDLRSPLATIGGFCELLLGLGRTHIDDQCKSIIRHMLGTVRHMNQLMETLLNFSRISNREMNREEVNLGLLANFAAAQLRMREPNRKVEFDIIESAVVEGDSRLLREVMENLLDNAWKYTGKQERALIEFGRKKVDGSTVYFIRDNGPGFDMTHAERIFNPFQRLHSREEFAGYGIGLATARRIIQRHGGRIWAEGKPGQGATFYFSIPAQN